jgi:predicted  nucleic acid-binding Zn-ribbon protein
MGMGVKQLYEFQCLEQEIEACKEELENSQAALGESPLLKKAKTNLVEAESNLKNIRAEQKATESNIADISAKVAAVTESLYSGRIKNPKELQNLQQEISYLHNMLNPLEERDLSLMEQAEVAENLLGQRSEELARVEKIWLDEQRALTAIIENLKQKMAVLKQELGASASAISISEMALYAQLKKTRGWGIARMEQGTCGRCRLSLSTAEVQRARTGKLINCSSCGRLLYFE